jgi:hypothetical protein
MHYLFFLHRILSEKLSCHILVIIHIDVQIIIYHKALLYGLVVFVCSYAQ